MSGESGSVGCQAKTHQHQLKVEVDRSVDGEVIGDDDDELREIKEEEMDQQPESDFEMDELDSSTGSSGSTSTDSETGSDIETSVAESLRDDDDWVPRHWQRERSSPPQHRYNLRQARTASRRYSPIHSPPPRRGRGRRSQTIVGLRAELSAAKLDLDRLREENAALLAVQTEIFDQVIPKHAQLEATNCDFALSLAREWMAKLVCGEGRRVEALATIFDLIKDGLHDKKSLDRLFERLVLQTQ